MPPRNNGDVLRKLAEAAVAKTLDDISDSTVNNRDESFIKPVVMDAPPRDITDNEIAIDANASDKEGGAKEVLKDAVKDTLPSTTPSGPPPHGNLVDAEKSESIAEEVTTKAVEEAAPAEPAEPAAVDPEVDALNKELARVTERAEKGKALPFVDAINGLKDKLEHIIEIKPKIDEIHALLEQLQSGAKPAPAPVETPEKLDGGLADGKPDTAADPEQLDKGVETEKEHTSDPEVAKEIAKDHLAEDPKYYDRLEKMEEGAEKENEAKVEKTAQIDVLTGAPGAGKTTAAKKHGKAYDVVLHGDLPLKMTDAQRRVAVVKRIREAMRSHNMGKNVLVDSAPRQLQRSYKPLLNSAKRVIILDVPEDVAAAGFAKRTKTPPERARRVVALANQTLMDLRADPRVSTVDRGTVGDALRKVAMSSEPPHTPAKPMRRRVEVLVVDGLNVFAVEKPYSQGGVWFPGGGVDGPEEKFADAAVREVKEETGIVIDEIHRLDGVDPVECVWDQDANSDNPKWAEKAKHWRGDRTYFYVATAKKTGAATGDDPLKGRWMPMKDVLPRLMQSIPFDNKGWQPLTKARLAAITNVMPRVRTAPRAS